MCYKNISLHPRQKRSRLVKPAGVIRRVEVNDRRLRADIRRLAGQCKTSRFRTMRRSSETLLEALGAEDWDTVFVQLGHIARGQRNRQDDRVRLAQDLMTRLRPYIDPTLRPPLSSR
ncbi:hypothetical protein IPF89_00530 [Candidatus Saccharibacteria bacterium]|nr:MAG: hypothetical protein IPF89_00530 [Candidatus Saccharibacteria bacterium]